MSKRAANPELNRIADLLVVETRVCHKTAVAWLNGKAVLPVVSYALAAAAKKLGLRSPAVASAAKKVA